MEVPVLLLSYERRNVSPGIWGVFNLCKLLITDMQQHLPDGYLWRPGKQSLLPADLTLLEPGRPGLLSPTLFSKSEVCSPFSCTVRQLQQFTHVALTGSQKGGPPAPSSLLLTPSRHEFGLQT